jgi:hypothetical protein
MLTGAARVEQLKALDAAALVTELCALSDAGSRLDDQALCCARLGQLAPSAGTTAADAVRAIVSALSRAVQHAMLQLAGCQALKALALEPANRAAVGTTAITVVLAALRAHPANAAVQGAACAALSVELAALGADGRAAAGAAGGVATVVAALTQHPADLNVAVHGCNALANLAHGHAQNVAAALDAGAVTAALAAMRAFPAAVGVQSAGCMALSGVMTAAGLLGSAHAESAAIADAVVAALDAHAGDRMVHLHGGNVLIYLFRENRNADATWVQRGSAALTVVTALLRSHREDAHVLSIGCVAITRLIQSTQNNKRAAGVGGAICALVAALRTFPEAAELQQHGLRALGNMCVSVHDNRLTAAAAGGLEVTVSAMRTHATHADVQLAGCYTLSALVANLPPSQTRAGELGGVEAVVASLQVCDVPLPAQRSTFFQCWSQALLILVLRHPNNHKAVAAGGIELLVAHMCAPAADVHASVFVWACRIFEQLLGGSGHEARGITAGALEALEAQRAQAPAAEAMRVKLIRHLKPVAERHDAAPCAVAACKRCAEARARGAMCALPGCGARGRDGGAKKLLRCGTCRAACYCSAAHQREDWKNRHKAQCGAAPRDNSEDSSESEDADASGS